MTAPVVDDFISRVETVIAETGDMAEITSRVAELARPLAEDTSWLEGRHRETDEHQGFGVAVVHAAPDHGLLVETVCWAPGRGVAPHDHQTWGVVIGLEGEEINVDWRRLDDGSEPGHARIENARETVVRQGVACVLMPDDIHSVRNEGDAPSVSLHVYGRNLATIERSEFDPIGQRQYPCPQRARK